jgi:hypothetical protein
MKKRLLTLCAIQICIFATQSPIFAQDQTSAPPVMSTPAATDAEKEAFYATSIENRVGDILNELDLSDTNKEAAVHDILVAQYHELRIRDAAIDTRLQVDGKEITYSNRAALLVAQSKPLHDQFVAKLNATLTPEQVEQVKDLMTYKKVKVTYDAYCSILPNLSDADKTKILDLLKSAREEAIDGGSASEKSAIFQKYKEQINSYLDSEGHDTAKTFREWVAQHAATNSVPSAK